MHMQAHRLSHMAAIMAGFDVLSVAACFTIVSAPECTEPLGISVAGFWFACHCILSLAVLYVTASHHFSLPAAPSAVAGGAASTLNSVYAPGLAPRAYAAVSALFTALVFGSMLQLPAAGVLSGEFVSFQSTWNVDGSRVMAVLRRFATLAAFAAAAIGLYNGGAFLLLNDFRIVRLSPLLPPLAPLFIYTCRHLAPQRGASLLWAPRCATPSSFSGCLGSLWVNLRSEFLYSFRVD